MTFTDSQVWFTILIVLHVLGAIAGIGPTYAFGLIGSMAKKESPEGSRALLRALVKINSAMPTPVFFVLQPLTGALLIFNRSSIRANFWKEEWLLISIGIYILLVVLIVPDNRHLKRALELADAGQANTEEFQGLMAKAQKVGPILGILVTTLIVLMIWKPLSECAGTVLRC